MAKTIDPLADMTGETSQQQTKPKQTIQQAGEEWDKTHPAPTKTEVKVPELTNKYDYASILKQHEPQEDYDAQMKRERTNRIIAGVGDAISSIAQLYAANKSGYYAKPTSTLSDVYKERMEKLKERQAKDRENYLKLYQAAAKQEQDDNYKKLSIYNQQKRDADNDYNSRVRQHALDRKNHLDALDKQQDNDRYAEKNAADAEARKAAQKETERHNSAIEANSAARLNETKRHNNATENILQNKPSTKGNPQTFSGSKGTVSCDKPKSQQELINIVAEMQAAGLFGGTNMVSKINRRRASVGDAIQRGLGSAQGVRIMKKHGFK